MPWLRSGLVSTAPATGSLKLGQPVPLSNFSLDANNGWSQPAHRNVPARFSCSNAQLPGISVPCLRMICVLLGREQLAPFGVRMRDRVFLRHHLSRSSQSSFRGAPKVRTRNPETNVVSFRWIPGSSP